MGAFLFRRNLPPAVRDRVIDRPAAEFAGFPVRETAGMDIVMPLGKLSINPPLGII